MARAKSKITEPQESTAEVPAEATPPSLTAVSRGLESPLVDGLNAFYAAAHDQAVARFDAAMNDAGANKDAKAKAAYWRAEALLQKETTPDKIALFEEVADSRSDHYLTAAARRRAEALKVYFATFETE